MKLAFAFLLILCACSHSQLTKSKAGPQSLSCVAHSDSEMTEFEKCALKYSSENLSSVRLEPSVLKQISFDKDSLAAVMISDEGCYWANSQGLIRKTQCLDNSADDFKEGFARYIDENGRYGFMDKSLKITTPATFDFAKPIHKGRSEVCIGCRTVNEGEHSRIEGGKWHSIQVK